MNNEYDKDFHAWAFNQAHLVRTGKLEQLDIANIAEELESMGRREKNELVSRLTLLFHHLLKWQFQPERQSRSWKLTIQHQRSSLADLLEDNPSLKAELHTSVGKAYRRGLRDVSKETEIKASTFPVKPPWTLEQTLDEDYWPEV